MKKLLVTLLCLSIFTHNPVYASSLVNITISDVVVQGLEQIKYMALNGEDSIVDYNITLAEMNGVFHNVYFLESPESITKLPREEAMPSYLDSDTIITILTLKERLSTVDIEKQTGCKLSENEYVAATQVAISNVVAINSQQYKMQLNSISNQDVLDVAAWLVRLENM